MRPTFIVHYQGSRPYAADRWSKTYQSQGMAAGQAMQALLRHRNGTDWTARVFRIGHEDFRGNDPGLVLTLVQSIEAP